MPALFTNATAGAMLALTSAANCGVEVGEITSTMVAKNYRANLVVNQQHGGGVRCKGGFVHDV
jgi:hypothetical protein